MFQPFSNKINDKWIIKSGCDFKDLSLINLEKLSSKKPIVTKIERYFVDSKIEEDSHLKKSIDHYISKNF